MQTRERLIQLAQSAIRRSGYGGFSYGDLAKAASIRKPSIHHHFPVKADLGLAALDDYADRLAETFAAISLRHRSGAAAMNAVIAHYRDLLGDGESMCLCAALAADRPLLDDKIASMLSRANRMTLDYLGEILRKGRGDRTISVAGELTSEAAALLGLLHGAQLLARASADPATFDAAMTPFAARISRQ